MRGEDTYHGQLDHEVREEDLLGTLPLLLCCWDLVRLKLPFPEVWDLVDDDPWHATSEVDNLNGAG